jgi:hypothetical protein
MKKLYSFVLKKETEVDKIEVTKDEMGAEIKKTTKVKEQVAKSYFFARPVRKLQDAIKFFKAKKESEFIRGGILSMAQVHKKIFDDNTLLSEDQKKEYQNLRDDWVKVQTEYFEIPPEDKRNDQEKISAKEIEDKLTTLHKKMQPYQDIDNAYSNLYENTAEIMAQREATRYLALMASYEDLGDDKCKSIFGEGDEEARMGVYDSIEDGEDNYMYDLISRFFFVANFYMQNKAETQEDYTLLIKIQENAGLLKKTD